MFSSFIISLISYILFSQNYFTEISFFDHDYGQIIKAQESDYYLNKVLRWENLDISASNILVLDLEKNEYILDRNSDQAVPIASISKLMSALVLLEDLDIDLDDYYKIKEYDRRSGGRDNVFVGDEVMLGDLLALSLIASDNSAIVALVSSLNLSESDFSLLMNKKARELGLKNSFFKDASGLSSANISSAKDLAILLQRVFENKEISKLLAMDSYSFNTKANKKVNAWSTNRLLGNFSDVDEIELLGGKTGYNILSGYCLTTKVKVGNSNIIIIVLNSDTLNNRFVDTEKIINELLKNEINS